jgi:hypothetical protein
VVRAEHAGAVPGGDRRGRERALQALVGGQVQGLADEVLVRQRHQHRPPGCGELVQAAADLQGLPGVLVEVVRRVDEDAVAAHAALHRVFGQPGDGRDHVGDDIGVPGAVRATARREPARVGADQAGPGVGRDAGDPGVRAAPRVVDQVGPGVDSGPGHFGPPRVYGDHHVREPLADGRDGRDGTPALLGGPHLRTRARLDPADVDDVRTGRHGPVDGAQGDIGVERGSVVVERVRRAVHDGHHRVVARAERAAAEP